MPVVRPLRRVVSRRVVRGAAALAVACALFSTACEYQVQVQRTPTATAGPLGVRAVTTMTPGEQPAVQPGLVVQSAAQTAGTAQQPAATSVADARPSTAAQAPASNQSTSSGSTSSTTSTGTSGVAVAVPSSAPASSVSAPAAPAPSTSSAALRETGTTPAPQSLQSTLVPVAPTTTSGGSRATSMPRASSTTPPRPSATPTVTPTVAPTATPTVKPSPTPAGRTLITLVPGANEFLYVGTTMPVNRALESIEGSYESVYYTPHGGGTVTYRPGLDTPPNLPSGTRVYIQMKRGAIYVMNP